MTNDTTPNLHLRPFAGASDYAKIAEVVNACADNAPLWFADTEETVANRYSNLVNCDPYKDMIIAEIDGEMVGYSRSGWNDETDFGRLYHFSLIVKPTFRNQGITEQLKAWMEEHIFQMAIEHGTTERSFIQSYQANADVENIQLLEGSGFTPYRQFLGYIRSIEDKLPTVQLPKGIELRPVTSEHYRAVWQVWNEVLQDTIGYSPATEEHYQAWLNDIVFFQPHLWQVAWDIAANQIAGFAINFEERVENERFNRKRASNIDLGVRRPWRRQGLAKALVTQSLHSFQAIGMTETYFGFEATTLAWAKPILEQNGFVLSLKSTDYRKKLKVTP